MRDNFKKARMQARFGRFYVTNGQARMRVKRNLKKLLTTD